MSLKFNLRALEGMSDEALKALRSEFLDALASDNHLDVERFDLLQALNRIEMILRRRNIPSTQTGPYPSI
ncbi:hypothetical protein [uncultured Roseobacter sp.]|uniref:hypothetical protein n=1 Tax=uncultured Roseobacter sp. TaxID=114847 RepID=UPI0026209145|nr:hypothetical protein [uncultured Roseobacter sp.]